MPEEGLQRDHPGDQPEPDGHEGEQPAEAPAEQPAAEEPIETRGIGWVIVPALVLGALGAGIGMLHVANLRPAPGGERWTVGMGAAQGAIIGLIIGAVFGLIVWVMFPYKGRNPHAVPKEPEDGEEGGIV